MCGRSIQLVNVNRGTVGRGTVWRMIAETSFFYLSIISIHGRWITISCGFRFCPDTPTLMQLHGGMIPEQTNAKEFWFHHISFSHYLAQPFGQQSAVRCHPNPSATQMLIEFGRHYQFIISVLIVNGIFPLINPKFIQLKVIHNK